MEFLKQILSGIEACTGVKPTAFNTSTVFELPAINYQAFRQSDDGAVESWRLETRCVADSMLESLELDSSIAECIVTVGDEDRFLCTHIVQNGGGVLEDTATGKPITISYFDITTKS